MIYIIKSINGTADVIDLDISKMADKLKPNAPVGLDLREYLYFLPYCNSTSSRFWPDGALSCSFFSNSKETYGDINHYGSFLVLTEKAYQLLKESMDKYGEFLKLDVEGIPMVLFNPLRFVSDELQHCKKSYFEGEEVGIESLSFDDKAADNLIFKSKYTAGTRMYCNEEFKNLVKNAGLKGVVFDEDINNIY
mgnify:FL=1